MINNIKIETPLYSEINERACLSSFEISDESSIALYKELSEEHFYKPEHKRLFKIFCDLILKGNRIRPTSVNPLIPADDVALQLLYKSLSEEPVNEDEIDKYIEVLRHKLKYRRLENVHRELGTDLKNGTKDPSIVINRMQDEIVNITSENTGDGDDSLSSIYSKTIDDIDLIEPIKDGLVGAPTGMEGLDRLTLGLQRKHLIVLAGRPSVGKTEYSIQTIVDSVKQTKDPALYFSVETDQQTISNRMLACETGIPIYNIRLRRFSDEQKRIIKEKLPYIKSLPISIIDDPIMTISKIHSRIRKEQYLKGDVGLVVVDYLQLLKGSSNNRVQEISQISWGLKILAKQLNVCVIALSQLSRNIEVRGDDWNVPPKLSDLRDGGSIEQDADEIMFLTAEPRKDPSTGFNLNKRRSILWLQKQKDGPIGNINLINYCNLARFKEEKVQTSNSFNFN